VESTRRPHKSFDKCTERFLDPYVRNFPFRIRASGESHPSRIYVWKDVSTGQGGQIWLRSCGGVYRREQRKAENMRKELHGGGRKFCERGTFADVDGGEKSAPGDREHGPREKGERRRGKDRKNVRAPPTQKENRLKQGGWAMTAGHEKETSLNQVSKQKPEGSGTHRAYRGGGGRRKKNRPKRKKTKGGKNDPASAGNLSQKGSWGVHR